MPASEGFQSHQGNRESQQEHLLPGGMARIQGGWSWVGGHAHIRSLRGRI